MGRAFTDEQFEKRFWAKVDKTRACWIWVGAIDNHGYGKVRFKESTIGAHRIAYMLVKGNIPSGLDLDHLCRNRSCVNPDHHEPVTRKVNLQRGVAARRKGLCVAGLHKMTTANTYVNPTTGKPRCRSCRDVYRRKYWLEKHDNRV